MFHEGYLATNISSEMKSVHNKVAFSRVTLVAASEFLECHSQARFNQMVVRLELEQEIPTDINMSVQKKCAELAKIVTRCPEIPLETFEGRIPLGEAVVREAVAIARRESRWEPQARFERALARDGYSLTWTAEGGAVLRPALPVELEAKTDDEVHHLLTAHGFATARGHLDQALNAHVRGDWAAANAQLRTFTESLVDEIANSLRPNEAQGLTPENQRALLGRIGFFSKERKEWTGDGKNYVNGLCKMLHTEGSHSGLSDMEHSTFRLHLVMLTARTFLRRLHHWN